MKQYGTVVLGCTHYPYYTNILESVLPDHVQVIDGSQGTVKRLKQLLGVSDQSGKWDESQISFLSSSGREEDREKMKRALAYLESC